MPATKRYDRQWQEFLSGTFHDKRFTRHLWRFVPSEPRCRMCNVPYGGIGGFFAYHLLHRRPSSKNPTMCNVCDDFAREHPGGGEIEMGFLFADIRGSTALAETMSPSEFSDLLNRFYKAANSVLVNHDAWIDKMVGDEVVAFYIPGFAGPNYANKAIHSAQRLLEATGHGKKGEPWAPVGVGVHVGVAYVGTIGSGDTVTDLTALGDPVNVTARLASAAGPGEILITGAAARAAKLDVASLDSRTLDLKGKSEAMEVSVLKV